MGKENELIIREKELARAYDKKMAARERTIRETAESYQVPPEPGDYAARNLHRLFEMRFRESFAEKKYDKPSEFFLAEMPWIFGLVVYERYKEPFLCMVDRIRDYPYSVGWSRRSFRSGDYLSYQGRIWSILQHFSGVSVIDADVKDILAGNLPEDARCYLKHRNQYFTPFVPGMLAYELDRNDEELEAIVTEIVNGENGFTRVSRSLIEGIVMSRNPRMHELLCKLLLAARLQEGLRQAICETADFGTKEAFLAILSTIEEHDLIRYSSVKRAVGTWIGVMTEETRDLDRVSGKSLELIRRCLTEESFREESLNGEDAMAIHIALWSHAFDNVRQGYKILDRLIATGTHHQVLTAGYFVANLEEPLLRQIAARNVLKSRRDHEDILAVYLPSLIPLTNGIANSLSKGHRDPALDHYFESTDQAKEFCDWLMEVHAGLKKKELEFSPCIFPWYSAVLRKSDLVEKAMVIAVLAEDQERKDRLCAHLVDCDAYGRSIYLSLLASGKKTPAVRKAIMDSMQDKSQDTRRGAFELAKGITLTAEEYRLVEQMLRLRYDDLRRSAMELLMKQSNEELEETIRRLLASSKTPMRTAGLDLVTQLQKSEDRRFLAESCMDAVLAIAKPTTQEKILIDALMPAAEEVKEESLFTEKDRHVPVVQIGEYEKECIRAFMQVFPDSKLEAQILAGNPVTQEPVKTDAPISAGAKRARENLESLHAFFVAHQYDTYTFYDGREIPLGAPLHSFTVWLDNGTHTVPRMDLWEQWQKENGITAADLYGMMVLSAAQPDSLPYLICCGRYVCDVFGAGFEVRRNSRYAGYVERITFELLKASVPYEQQQKIALALGIWISRCLPDSMFLGDSGEKPQEPPKNENGEVVLHYLDANIRYRWGQHGSIGSAGHFIAHPQFSAFINQLDPDNTPGLTHRIPVLLNIMQRTYASTGAYIKANGMKNQILITMVLKVIYLNSFRFQTSKEVGVSVYLYAHHHGMISDRTLYCHLMDPVNFGNALNLITSVCVMAPREGEQISSRTFQGYRSGPIRRRYENFIGKDTPEEEQKRLVELCHRTAETLVPIVVNAELLRGDTPVAYSAYVTSIQALSGVETFVRILSALGKDSLDRSVYYWGSSHSKRGNLSYLLSRCAPAPDDDAGKLGQLLKGTDITEKRLIEAALYSSGWIDIIGEYLDLPGFKSACYYFMAHMNEKFDDRRKAIIARFTPLSEDELNLGAFDVQWFRSAFGQLGEKKFDLIYDAAKYISDGSKHTRARKYVDAALGRMDAGQTEEIIRDKRNKDLLMAYAIIPLESEDDLIHRYLYLQQFLKESRQFGSQRSASEKKAVGTALRNLATNAGFSDTMRLTLRMETKLVEDNLELFEEKTVGEWVFRLLIDDQGTAEICCSKDGKQLKAIPAKAKKDPYVVRLTDMKKQLTEQYRRTRRMFEQAMEDGAEFTLEEMRQLCENPVVLPIVSKLVFKSGENLGLFTGAVLVGHDRAVLEDRPDAMLTVAHPLHLYRGGVWHTFQKYLFAHQIIQPFRQVFRELYVKTKDELGAIHSLRYAGNQIQPKKAVACLKDRRWVADVEAGLQKIYYQDNIIATIYALADWFTPADIEAPTLEYVAFYERKTGKALKIDQVPDVIFSEVMRDVDMAVSVAHAGGVDPETSHSTVEMRAAILEFTLPLLRLGNVRVEGSHAFIDGKLAQYAVHLGSGVVHQLGGTMLSVLPVHSQHRGRFFLPFADDDPKTAEIISKVILFAEDGKLKDPSILEQITK